VFRGPSRRYSIIHIDREAFFASVEQQIEPLDVRLGFADKTDITAEEYAINSTTT
jgi:hypothetical protein